MIAVIFEVWPHAHHRDDYFNLAAELRPHLQKIDGFISVERFESLSEAEARARIASQAPLTMTAGPGPAPISASSARTG